jgi:glycosyltransferase involved in cell wall biosynthesis
MSEIVLVTALPICRNPRVNKEASALQSAGFHVTVLAPTFNQETVDEDRRLSEQGGWIHKISVNLGEKNVTTLLIRLERRLGIELVKRFSLQMPQSLGYAPTKILHLARRHEADLYIGHSELGMWVVHQLAQGGARTGVDIEDWYSEDLLPEARSQRPLPLLRRLERAALRRGGHCTTTSRTLARQLATSYDAPAPAVIYNAFPWSDRQKLDHLHKDRLSSGRPSLHWVSQTIGPGRGLELLFEALKFVTTPVDIHLRGSCSTSEETRLRGLFPTSSGHGLYIHSLVSNKELLSRIAEHDIGLALEPKEPPNKDFTVSNKILHYLVAGVAVIATDTAGQQEVAHAAPQAVTLCKSRDAMSLAAALSTLLDNPHKLKASKKAALEAAQTHFCWEQQVPVLISSVESALRQPQLSPCAAS